MADIYDRGVNVIAGGKACTLVLTTGAAREIAKKYGGLDKLGDKLLKGKDENETIGIILSLTVLLANQGAELYNESHPDKKRNMLTEEYLMLHTTPADMRTLQESLVRALVLGTKRDVESEDDGKNVPAAG